MSIRRWVETSLWDEEYFDPSRLSPGVVIFSSGVSWPLVTSLINGCGGTPTWHLEASEQATPALFRSLRGLVRRYGASWFYVTDPDNALSVFHWEKEIDADYFNEFELAEFEKNPAEEGGISYLCIGLHDRAGLIVFEYGDPFRILLYGDQMRMREFQQALRIPTFLPTEEAV